ncbi:hypothetical protein GCM10009574_036210 [Streptomyces asiaticus]|uniref:Uncharacterized protein n=1 Tax=Streptomyces rhizosphaericus TaxID=114699 RepID=A0ABP4A2Z4_9ACTN
MSSEASPTASSALCGEWENLQSVRRADPEDIERAALGRQLGLPRTLLARPQPGGRFQPRPAIGESVAMVER